MKKSELIKIIKEEVSNVLAEGLEKAPLGPIGAYRDMAKDPLENRRAIFEGSLNSAFDLISGPVTDQGPPDSDYSDWYRGWLLDLERRRKDDSGDWNTLYVLENIFSQAYRCPRGEPADQTTCGGDENWRIFRTISYDEGIEEIIKRGLTTRIQSIN